jgi:hypothetical protein
LCGNLRPRLAALTKINVTVAFEMAWRVQRLDAMARRDIFGNGSIAPSRIVKTSMEITKQQAVADVLHMFKDSYIVGILNDYEMARKILQAITTAEIAEMERNLCLNCREAIRVTGSVLCSDCSAPYALVSEERAQTDSEAHYLAH